MELICLNMKPIRPTSGFTANGKEKPCDKASFLTCRVCIEALTKMVFGWVPVGSWLYISILPSPSYPPKVNVGFEAVKNQRDRALIQYAIQNGIIGIYFINQCQVSQCRNL